MKVAIVSGIDPNATKPGGTRSYVLSLIEKLSDEGIKTILFGTSYKSERRAPNLIPIVKGRDISSMRFLLNLFFKTPFFRMSKDVIIHTQRPDDLFPFVLFKKKNPKICTIHGIPSVGIQRRKGKITWGIFNFLERFSLKRVNRVIFIDANAEEWYLRKYGWLKNRSNVTPIGIDLNVFKPLEKKALRKKYGFGPEDKIILYVGRLEKEKRVDVLIESFKKLLKENETKFVVVGEGPERKKLQFLATNSLIQFIGTLPHERIPEILNCANVLVLCSEYEGMPTVVLEALACGIPVVSTDVGDVSKVVIDEKTGYLAKANVEDLKEKISMVFEDSERFKYHCLEMAKRYSLDVIAEKIINVYKEAYNEVSKES